MRISTPGSSWGWRRELRRRRSTDHTGECERERKNVCVCVRERDSGYCESE